MGYEWSSEWYATSVREGSQYPSQYPKVTYIPQPNTPVNFPVNFPVNITGNIPVNIPVNTNSSSIHKTWMLVHLYFPVVDTPEGGRSEKVTKRTSLDLRCYVQKEKTKRFLNLRKMHRLTRYLLPYPQ